MPLNLGTKSRVKVLFAKSADHLEQQINAEIKQLGLGESVKQIKFMPAHEGFAAMLVIAFM